MEAKAKETGVPPALRRNAKRFKCFKNPKRIKYISIISVVIFLAILALIISLAVILPRRTKLPKSFASTVLVPLYIYPLDGAWEPLYEMVIAQPNLNFTVILNPDSGPGSSPSPGDDFVPQIQKLNSYSNVRTVGYVRTGFGTRNISSVLLDVSTYSGWATNASANANSTGLALHGIFFDEIPSEFSEEADEYLNTINQAVKNSSGLLPDKTVIHNPGTIPDAGFTDTNTDITVVFEGSYQEYQEQEAALTSLPPGRLQYSYVIHSMPASMSEADLRNFAYSLSAQTGLFFLTDLSQDYYESFGPDWQGFIEAMPGSAG